MTRPPAGSSAGDAWIDVLLAVWRDGQRRSMVGPGDPRAHLERSFALADTLGEAPRMLLDLGSGAGIPGLALAGRWPRTRVILLEAANRRVRVLRAAVDELGWGDRVGVLHGRAEELGRRSEHRQRYPLVTARSFGPPAATAECGGAFLELGGVLAVTEPPGATGERWPPDGVRRLGLTLGPGDGGVQRLVRTEHLDDRFPRRPGVPGRRPLF